MMLYSVRDLKVGKYGSCFIMDNDMTATRSFLLSLADVTHPSPMTAFPMDFELYHVGDFDFVTGKLIPLPEGPRFVASVGSCQDEFSAMQKKYIQMAESLKSKATIESIKNMLLAFKDAFYTSLAEDLDYDDYKAVKSSFNDLIVKSSLLTKEELADE